MLHSFRVQPAGRLVRDCAIRRYGTGPAFSRPQPVRDGTAWTHKMLSPRRVGTGRDDLLESVPQEFSEMALKQSKI
ncbi:hypothetical protein YC2023_093418 [Brassica napus]